MSVVVSGLGGDAGVKRSDPFVELHRRQRRRRVAVVIGVATVIVAAGLLIDRALGWDAQPISEVLVQAPNCLYVMGHCHDAARVDVDEQGDVVELELLTRGSRRGDCGDGVEVTLAEPLGSRRVVDTATGEAPPLCESDGLPSC